MNGGDGLTDLVGAAAGLAEDPPGLQPGEGALARGSQAGMVTVELCVFFGQVTAVVRSADGAVGSSVGAVGEDEDLPGEAGLDHAVCAGGGQVVGATGQGPGEPQRCAVRAGDDLHVHPVPPVFLRVVRLVGGNAVGGDQRAVEDHEPLRQQGPQRGVQARGVLGEDLDGLVDISAGCRGGDAEPGSYLGECLVLAQMSQGKERLAEATEPSPRRVQFTPSGIDEPGDVLHDLMRDVEHGTIRNHEAPRLQRGCVENTSATTRSLAASPIPTARSSPLRHTMRRVH